MLFSVKKAVAGVLIGLGAAAVVLATDALLTAIGGDGQNFLQSIEFKTYDWRLTHTAQPATARRDIALIDIDEYSLRNLEPNTGRWPWPRAVHSMLHRLSGACAGQGDRLRRRVQCSGRAVGFSIRWRDVDRR